MNLKLRQLGRFFCPIGRCLRWSGCLVLPLTGWLLAHEANLSASAASLLDSSFQPGTGPNDTLYDVAVEPGGKILIAGFFTSFNGTARNYIARLNADGSLDKTFNASLTIGKNQGTGRGQCLAIQPDGRILVGGCFSKANGYACQNIVRFNPDGSLDRSFVASVGGGGVVSSMSVLNDGRIFLVGAFSVVNGVAQRGYARLLPDGSLDPTFAHIGGASDSVTDFALLPSGRVIIGGYFQKVNSQPCNYLARLQADGTLDLSFQLQPSLDVGPIYALALQPVSPDNPSSNDDGFKILCGFNTLPASPLVRFWPDGTYDTKLAEGVVADITRIQVTSEASILVIGTALGPSSLRSVLLLTPDGAPVPTFWPARACALGSIFSLAVSDAGVLIAGDFASINGQSCPRVARVDKEPLPANYSAISLGVPVVSSARSGSGWTARLLLSVNDLSGAPVPNVLITGKWTTWGGTSKNVPISVPLYTDSNGEYISSQVFSRSCWEADFTLTGLEPAAGTYYEPLLDKIHLPLGPFGNDNKLGISEP